MTTAPHAAGDRGEGRSPGIPAWHAVTASSDVAPSGATPQAEPAGSREGAARTSRAAAPATRADAPVGPSAGTAEHALLERLLGPATLRLGSTARDRLWGWLGPLLVTALAAVLRFVDLGRPPTLVFDETYYVKQAYTLLTVGYEARWPEDPDPAFAAGDVDTFLPQADYAVHPQVGKWLIALGLRLVGPDDPVGWRLAAAVAGTLAVLLLARTARRLFASTALGTIAGGLLAVDGQAIVHSRTSLLDGFLMLFVVAAFGALVRDREWGRRRLAERLAGDASWADRHSGPLDRALGPALGARPWRLLAGVLLGLAIGTKWSGITFLAVFGLLTVAWDVTARRTAGVPRWLAGGVLRDGVPAFAAMVPVAAAVYVVGWSSWFRTPGAYLRDWAATHPGEGVTWLPETLRSWWHYHGQMWTFHRGLTSEHTYEAHPLGWPVQWRPTYFFYETPVPAQAACGADRCSVAVTALGNPVLWWLASALALVAVWAFVRHRDWRAAAALSGVVAGWVPWLGLAHRTIFTFYSVAFAPWMVLLVTWGLSRALGLPDDGGGRAAASATDGGPGAGTGADLRAEARRRAGLAVTVAVLVVIAVVSAFFWPVWTGQPVPFGFWRLHVWLPRWT